jgi:hypothetical protein
MVYNYRNLIFRSMAYYPLPQYCVYFHVRKDKTLYPIHLVAKRKNPLTRYICNTEKQSINFKISIFQYSDFCYIFVKSTLYIYD